MYPIKNFCVVRLSGGLGNQLFQYSYGCYLERAKLGKVLYDVSYYKRFSDRKMRLNRFELNLPTSNSVVNRLMYDIDNSRRYRIPRGLIKAIKGNRYHTIKESGCIIDYDMAIRRGHCFVGYWQNIEYAEVAKSYLKEKMKDAIKNIHLVSSNEVCALHARRGDYVRADVRNRLGVLDESYYLKAVEIMRECFGVMRVIVFSDDIDYAKQLSMKIPTSSAADKEILDDDMTTFMAIMQCKYHIISNSTFSWWAAYLADMRDGHVIMPKKWSKYDSDKSYRLRCEGWQML